MHLLQFFSFCSYISKPLNLHTAPRISSMDPTTPVAGRSKIPSMSPRSDRVASKYLDSFVFGSFSPRQKELFVIEEESVENQFPEHPVRSSTVYGTNKSHTLRNHWRNKLLRARCVGSYVCAIIILVLLVVLTLAITIPLTLRQHRNTQNSLKSIDIGPTNNVSTSTRAFRNATMA
jgi:hypothetical protein